MIKVGPLAAERLERGSMPFAQALDRLLALAALDDVDEPGRERTVMGAAPVRAEQRHEPDHRCARGGTRRSRDSPRRYSDGDRSRPSRNY